MKPEGVEPIRRLMLELGRLPGVGERSAARLAFHIVRQSQQGRGGHTPSLAQDLAAALVQVDQTVTLCDICQNLASGGQCRICTDNRRDRGLVCVVEEVQDLRAIEQAGFCQGTYHVLHGALTPLEGVGPDDLKIRELLRRLEGGGGREVILATSHNVEGDATALYLARLIRPLGPKITRLASGVPLGGELEYLDQGTLQRALIERRTFAEAS